MKLTMSFQKFNLECSSFTIHKVDVENEERLPAGTLIIAGFASTPQSVEMSEVWDSITEGKKFAAIISEGKQSIKYTCRILKGLQSPVEMFLSVRGVVEE